MSVVGGVKILKCFDIVAGVASPLESTSFQSLLVMFTKTAGLWFELQGKQLTQTG